MCYYIPRRHIPLHGDKHTPMEDFYNESKQKDFDCSLGIGSVHRRIDRLRQ